MSLLALKLLVACPAPDAMDSRYPTETQDETATPDSTETGDSSDTQDSADTADTQPAPFTVKELQDALTALYTICLKDFNGVEHDACVANREAMDETLNTFRAAMAADTGYANSNNFPVTGYFAMEPSGSYVNGFIIPGNQKDLLRTVLEACEAGNNCDWNTATSDSYTISAFFTVDEGELNSWAGDESSDPFNIQEHWPSSAPNRIRAQMSLSDWTDALNHSLPLKFPPYDILDKMLVVDQADTHHHNVRLPVMGTHTYYGSPNVTLAIDQKTNEAVPIHDITQYDVSTYAAELEAAATQLRERAEERSFMTTTFTGKTLKVGIIQGFLSVSE